MSSREDIFGVDWGEVGKGALGVGHVTGKLLLNAFAGGAGVSQIDALQEKGGLLPEWAAKAPTLVANKPEQVSVLMKNGKTLVMKDVTKITVRGGTRVDGTGYAGVEAPTRVEIEQPSGKTTPDLKAVLVQGGIEAVATQPSSGIASIVRVTGENMSDDNEPDINLEVVSEPDDAGTVDVFGDLAIGPMLASGPTMAAPHGRAIGPMLASGPKVAAHRGHAIGPMLASGPTAAAHRQNWLQRSLSAVRHKVDVLGELSSDRSIPLEMRLAQHRLSEAQARLAATQARQPRTPAALQPMNIQNYDFTQLAPTAIDENFDADFADDVLGHSDSPGWVEVSGGDDAESDYFVGTDAIGAPFSSSTVARPPSGLVSRAGGTVPQRTAIPPRAASSRPVVPLRGKVPKKPLRQPKPSKGNLLMKALDRANMIANKAKARGVRLNAKFKQIKARANAPTAVHGDIDILGSGADWSEIVGAAVRPSAGRTPVTAQQKSAARNLERARAKLAKAITKAQGKGDKLIAKATGLQQKVVTARPIVKKLANKKVTFPAPRRAGTKVHGDEEILGDMDFELLGLEPGEEGYDPRFDDPNYSGDLSAPSADGTTPTDGGYVAPNLDTPCVLPTPVELPTRGTPLTEEEAMTMYATVPEGAVSYQLERGLPSVGSVSVMYDKTGLKDGFKFGLGRYRTMDANLSEPDWVLRDYIGSYKVNNNGAVPWGAQNTDVERARRKGLGWGEMTFWAAKDGLFDSVPQIARASIAASTSVVDKTSDGLYSETSPVTSYSWGPLVGDPNGILAGLQYAYDQDQWFWLPEHAPKWATQVQDDLIKQTNKEAAATAQAECDLQKQQDAIDAAERERDRAAKEYDLSMATNQQEVESAINADKLAQAQQAADQQMATMQSQLEMQATQADLNWQVQQADLDQQTDSAALQYAMEHPDEVQQGQYGGEQGFDEASPVDAFTNDGFFEGTSAANSLEEDLLDQAQEDLPDLDFVQQQGAIEDFDTGPQEF